MNTASQSAGGLAHNRIPSVEGATFLDTARIFCNFEMLASVLRAR